MDDSFDRAQAQYERMEPPDNRTEAVRQYQDASEDTQLEVCLSFLEDDKVYREFMEEMLGRIAKEHPEWITSWCEERDGFWEFLG